MKRRVVVAKAGGIPKVHKIKRKKETAKKTGSLGIVGIFFVLVFLLILISLCFRLVALVKKSSFDPSHRFTVLLASSERPSDHTAHIVSLEPDQQNASVLSVSYVSDTQTVESFLKIPIDGEVFYDGVNEISNPKDMSSELGKVLLHYNRVKSSLTIIDLVRLWWASQSLHSATVSLQSIDFGTNDVIVDRMTSSLFADRDILDEAKTITIVNATDVAGFGNRLARLISNMGGNVISVRSSNTIEKESKISYSDEAPSYTSQKIQSLLHITAERATSGSISDIVITIGEDLKDTSVF